MLLYAITLVKYDIIEMKGCRDETVPVKIRKLKADLRKAGFLERTAKGSHTRWYYQHDQSIVVTLSGNDGKDAQRYQIEQVYGAIKEAKEVK
jgi:predicted RNA binding protein YcfA (HicA-like mRNA interferase family)